MTQLSSNPNYQVDIIHPEYGQVSAATPEFLELDTANPWTLQLEFFAVENAISDVVIPLKNLQGMAFCKNNGELPMPVQIRIGTLLQISNIRIESVATILSCRFTAEGAPISAQVRLCLPALGNLDPKDIQWLVE